MNGAYIGTDVGVSWSLVVGWLVVGRWLVVGHERELCLNGAS